MPINVGSETMYAFNCLSFGVEDGLETLEFDNEDIERRFVFKSHLQGCTALYATESFKILCEKYGLEGLRFDEDLPDPF